MPEAPVNMFANVVVAINVSKNNSVSRLTIDRKGIYGVPEASVLEPLLHGGRPKQFCVETIHKATYCCPTLSSSVQILCTVN